MIQIDNRMINPKYVSELNWEVRVNSENKAELEIVQIVFNIIFKDEKIAFRTLNIEPSLKYNLISENTISEEDRKSFNDNFFIPELNKIQIELGFKEKAKEITTKSKK